MAPSIDCQFHWIPFNWSYSSSPVSQSFKKTPASPHCWKRSCAVELGQMPVAFKAFHWHPVFNTKRIASKQRRSSVRGRPPQTHACSCAWGEARGSFPRAHRTLANGRMQQSWSPVAPLSLALLPQVISAFWGYSDRVLALLSPGLATGAGS